MKKKMPFSKIILILLATALLLIGVFFATRPTINRIVQEAQAEKEVATFYAENDYGVETEQTPTGNIPIIKKKKSDIPPEETPYPELLEAMIAYNEHIHATKQAGLADPWCYTTTTINLSDYGYDKEEIGVLTIPAMDYEEPVFLGATYNHLDRGAAQLSISSMPIGGLNTNCVLAAHRGWEGAIHFKNVEQLQIGDTVYLTNPWEVLEYEVTGFKIIEPYQPEELLIQDGRDMLTLVTCHPYGSGGRYRYVVYCDRKTDPTPTKTERED